MASRHNLLHADVGCGTDLLQLPSRPVRGTGIQIQPKPRAPGMWMRARRNLVVRGLGRCCQRAPVAVAPAPYDAAARTLSGSASAPVVKSHTACRVGGAGRRGRIGRRGWRAWRRTLFHARGGFGCAWCGGLRDADRIVLLWDHAGGADTDEAPGFL